MFNNEVLLILNSYRKMVGTQEDKTVSMGATNIFGGTIAPLDGNIRLMLNSFKGILLLD